jgi:hypothetical protein
MMTLATKSAFALVLAAALLAAGCAAPAAKRGAAASGVVPSDVPAAGRLHGYVVARRHGDFSLAGGKERRYEVEYGWDYDQATALRKTFDANGTLLKTQRLNGAEFPLTEAERERVRALMRGQPALKPIVDRPGVVIWAGGFAYQKRDDPYCGRGSRCIHAIAAADDGDTAVAHAIVDLQTDRVVYPFYQPAEGEPVGKIHGE